MCNQKLPNEEIRALADADRSRASSTISWKPGELENILLRANKLTLAELKELTQKVGIVFKNDVSAEEYLEVLDEANSLETIEAFLTKKGL
ncbi:MAG: hypothetical protein WCJ29_00555 [bacterium]